MMIVPILVTDLFFFVLLVFSFRIERHRVMEFSLFFLMAIVFALVVGSRVSSFGVDSPRYVNYFLSMGVSPFRSTLNPYWQRKIFIWHGDAGLNIVMWFLGHIYYNPTFFLVSLALIMALLVASAIYMTSLPSHSKILALLFCFMSYGMLLQFSNTLRQGLAIAILFPAVALWIERKKRFWPIVLWFLASETHLFTSILVLAAFVGAWILKKLKVKTFGYLLLIVVSLGIAQLIHHVLESNIALGSLLGIAKTYNALESSSAIYIRIGLVVLLSVVAVRVLAPSDNWLNLYLSVVLMTIMMLRSPEGAKRLIPLIFLTQPVIMVRIVERFRMPDWSRLIIGTAYAAGAMLFAILPPMIHNFMF